MINFNWSTGKVLQNMTEDRKPCGTGGHETSLIGRIGTDTALVELVSVVLTSFGRDGG